ICCPLGGYGAESPTAAELRSRVADAHRTRPLTRVESDAGDLLEQTVEYRCFIPKDGNSRLRRTIDTQSRDRVGIRFIRRALNARQRSVRSRSSRQWAVPRNHSLLYTLIAVIVGSIKDCDCSCSSRALSCRSLT